MAKSLSEKAMIVRLNIRSWTARKYDRGISDKVAADYNADKDAGRYNKGLIAQTAIKKIQKISNEARIYHYEQTLPWDDGDGRILPAANFLNYTAKMREHRAAFDQVTRDFIYDYPALVADAREKLNGMFNAADYPGANDIQNKFSFAVSISPLPDAGDFRITLSDGETDRIKDEITARADNATAAALRDLWGRLYSAVKHMSEKLKDKDAIFRDSLTGNIAELCELLPRLNITDDPALENARREVERELTGYNPDTLRKNETERETAARKAAEIADAMSAFMGA